MVRPDAFPTSARAYPRHRRRSMVSKSDTRHRLRGVECLVLEPMQPQETAVRDANGSALAMPLPSVPRPLQVLVGRPLRTDFE